MIMNVVYPVILNISHQTPIQLSRKDTAKNNILKTLFVDNLEKDHSYTEFIQR